MTTHPTRPFGNVRFGPELFIAFLVLGVGVLASPVLMIWYGLAGLLVGVAVSVFGSGVAFLFVLWMGVDASRSLKQAQGEHRHAKPDPNGDMTAVAAAPELPPWMGAGR